MITADDIKKKDTEAYHRILEKGLLIDEPVIRTEDVHRDSFLDRAIVYLMRKKNSTFTPEEVKTIHGLAFYGKEEPSEYKKTENAFLSPYYVVFIPAKPDEVEEAMFEWYEKYKDCGDLETVIKMVMDFCSIHPFEDGNGRTAYALMREVMHSIGFSCAFHLNIDKYVYERKVDNILAIQKSAGRGFGLQTVDYTAYIHFMLEVLDAAYDELLSAL